MADFKLEGPSPSKRRRKRSPVRPRAQTDVHQKAKQTQSNPEAKQDHDDFLDLFGIPSDGAQNGNVANGASNDPFGDFGFGSDSSTSPVVSQDDNVVVPTTKKKKKKKPKLPRAKTVADTESYESKSNGSSPVSAPITSKTSPKEKSAVKMKKIDVLPLLHRGIRANKFKLNGNKSRVRTFYLMDDNFHFCWEVVGQSSEKKGGLFGGKNKGQTARSKVDKERSIPIRHIRDVQKNPAHMMQTYSFIPAQSKAFTLTILYSMNGQDKKLNFMAYEPFHHTLFYEGLNQLMAASRDPKRNLNEVFELYVDFPKEILPKHLRPQRFKWEPLADGDYASQGSDTENANSNMFFDASPEKFAKMDVYDPTASGLFGGRSRVKSF